MDGTSVFSRTQISEPARQVSFRTEGLGQLVAAANHPRDDTSLSLYAAVHDRDLSLVVPEDDLVTLYQLEADPIAWVTRYSRQAPPVGQDRDLKPVNIIINATDVTGRPSFASWPL